MPLTKEQLTLINYVRSSGRTIAYNPVYSEIGGSANSGLLLSQLIYWTDKTEDGWIYKTWKDLQQEIGLNRREQDTAISKLKSVGVIEIELKNMPPKRFIKVDFEKISSLLINVYCTYTCNRVHDNVQSDAQNCANNNIHKITTLELDNKLSNNAEPALEKKKFGNEEINFILEEFERRWGFEPTDRMPRYAARALVMNFKKEFKLRNLEYSFDRFKNNFLRFIDWVMTQPWGEKIQKVDTLRLKFRIYKSPSKV